MATTEYEQLVEKTARFRDLHDLKRELNQMSEYLSKTDYYRAVVRIMDDYLAKQKCYSDHPPIFNEIMENLKKSIIDRCEEEIMLICDAMLKL